MVGQGHFANQSIFLVGIIFPLLMEEQLLIIDLYWLAWMTVCFESCGTGDTSSSIISQHRVLAVNELLKIKIKRTLFEIFLMESISPDLVLH